MKHVITIDFETFYTAEYSLTKMPMQEYIESRHFEIMGVAWSIDGADPTWMSGGNTDMPYHIRRLPWGDATCVAHNAQFEGAILNQCFDVNPARFFCTSMAARPHILPNLGSTSLADLVRVLKLGKKGEEVHNMMGFNLEMASNEMMEAYGEYCKNDVALTNKLYDILKSLLPPEEHDAIDFTVKKFTRPQVFLDRDTLEQYAAELEKERRATVEKALALAPDHNIRSTVQFREVLQDYGIVVPQGQSFGKDTPFMEGLRTHKKQTIRELAEARLALSSNLNATRTERLLNLCDGHERVPLRAPLWYYGASTGRWSGQAKINLQNLPRGGTLRRAIVPPKGWLLVAGDLSQIEMRLTAWFANEEQLLRAFQEGKDPYTSFAAAAFKVPYEEVNEVQRMIGKGCLLSQGFYGGPAALERTFRKFGVFDMSYDDCLEYSTLYRTTYTKIPLMWNKVRKLAELLWSEPNPDVPSMLKGVRFSPNRMDLPGNTCILYPNIKRRGQDRVSFHGGRREPMKLWTGLLVENMVQGTARNIIRDVERRVFKMHGRYAALTAHDELVYCVRGHEARDFANDLDAAMRVVPSYVPGLPLGCTVTIAPNYADCK